MQKLSLLFFSNSEFLTLLCLTLLILGIGYFLYHLKFFKAEKHRYLLSLTLLTIIYAVISFWQLGSTTFPTTTWQPAVEKQEIVLNFGKIEKFDAIYTIYGEGDNNSNPQSYQIGTQDIHLFGSNNLQQWQEITVLKQGNIYTYSIQEGYWEYQYIKLVTTNKNNSLTEIGFRNLAHSNFLPVTILQDEYKNTKYPAKMLIDEQDKLVLSPTYYNQAYFDEIYHVRNAWEIANRQYMYASVHPLLGTNIIALSIHLFGMHPFAWRLPGAIASVLMLPVLYGILKHLLKRDYLSLIGSFLLAADFMHITTARIATLEPFSILFILCSFYWMLKYCRSNFYTLPMWKGILYLFLSGIFMGLSIATKWTGCYAAIGLAIMLFTNWIQRFLEYKKDKETHQQFFKILLTTMLSCILFFIIIPIVIYCISYIPDKIFRNEPWTIANVWKQAQQMYHYHVNLNATHPYQSTWFQWILDLRPMWYYVGIKGNVFHTISCFSNPLLTWIGLPAILFTTYRALCKKDIVGWYIVVGYFSGLLPWIIYVQRIVFAYHFYPTSLFTIIAIVYCINLLNNRKMSIVVSAYLAAYLALFILFLPVITGFGTSQQFARFLAWLPGWYFG
ncbi:phospholipid carrier-dependent glycosyltransferase [Solobacterium moorei]|uniref:Polyprenol-phosphate-mannose--protein mannosyltransferase n=1 Tax=Solobacterium moorei F0204 TaxID=706433 RepID=E7MPD5_9FIRM|nr:phospholipid carrier-dependent glycosyltransferase [Solobacterium moorei]EFW24040.1 dolichyl-phosphate-mannose-protein mannosyltransferase [Solobacterium moorei F0204]